MPGYLPFAAKRFICKKQI